MKYLKAVALFVVIMIAAWTTSLPWECQTQQTNNQTEKKTEKPKYDCISFTSLPHVFLQIVERNDKAIVTLSTVVIAIFTVVLGISTIKLWSATDRLYESGKEQLAIAQKSADAAIIAAGASEYLMGADRAWLIFEEVRHAVVGHGTPVLSLNFYLWWVNTGKTPAIAVDVQADFCILPADAETPEFNLPFNPDDTCIVGQGKEVSSLKFTIPIDTIREMINNKVNIFFYSVAYYETIFKVGKRHQSEVCFLMRGRNINPGNPLVIDFEFVTVGSQNKID